MAAVGPTRQSRVSMSVSMSLVQGGAAASAAGTVLGELTEDKLHSRHYIRKPTKPHLNLFFSSLS